MDAGKISKISNTLILSGLLLSVLGLVFSSGYDSKKGFFGNLQDMRIILIGNKMAPYFDKVAPGEENPKAHIIKVPNNEESMTVYEFPQGSSLNEIRTVMKARYKNKDKDIFTGRFRFLEWYTVEDEVFVRYRFVLALGILLVFIGVAARLLLDGKKTT